MKSALPWTIAAFLAGFFVFQSVGYQQEKEEQLRRSTINWQVNALSQLLEFDAQQTEDYRNLRMAIVVKEKEFQDFRRDDIQAFLDSQPDFQDEKKIQELKDRHLSKLKKTKQEELDLWSDWIDTLGFEQRQHYVDMVFEHRPLDTSWYDRDLFDDLERIRQ